MPVYIPLQQNQVQEKGERVVFHVGVGKRMTRCLRKSQSISIIVKHIENMSCKQAPARTAGEETNTLFQAKVVLRVVDGVKIGCGRSAASANGHSTVQSQPSITPANDGGGRI